MNYDAFNDFAHGSCIVVLCSLRGRPWHQVLQGDERFGRGRLCRLLGCSLRCDLFWVVDWLRLWLRDWRGHRLWLMLLLLDVLSDGLGRVGDFDGYADLLRLLLNGGLWLFLILWIIRKVVKIVAILILVQHVILIIVLRARLALVALHCRSSDLLLELVLGWRAEHLVHLEEVCEALLVRRLVNHDIARFVVSVAILDHVWARMDT